MVLVFSLSFLVVILCFCFSLYEVVNFFISFDLLISGGYSWLAVADCDYITCLILTMLLICFLYVWNYTGHYFANSTEGCELNNMILFFVCVMAVLVLTGDLLFTLVFWEYLGVVSFFLILFYGSYLSLRASIVTLVSSRFGDVALFLLISFGGFVFNSYIISLICIIFVIITKSASFPFISWLLEAMRAPTPVSSLVHSSTLVAAGVWFSMRYDFNLVNFSNWFVLSCLLLFTTFVTGVCCFWFLDLKKVVALSTCNNIAWCVFYLLFGDVALSIFQLVSHGVSKCILFMLVGDVMSGSAGSQSINCIYSVNMYGNWGIFSLLCCIAGLSGVPYIGVFFTKHFLISSFTEIISIPLMLFISLCVFLSYFYSFRLCFVLLKNSVSSVVGVSFFFNTSLIAYFWLFINFFLFLCLDELCCLSVYYGLLLIIFQVIACFTAIFLCNNVLLADWSSSLFGCDNLVEMFYTLYLGVVCVVYMFFTRWDEMMISKFSGMFSASMLELKSILLNIMFISIFWLLMWYVIL